MNDYTKTLECFKALRTTTKSKEKLKILESYKEDETLAKVLHAAYSGDKYFISPDQVDPFMQEETMFPVYDDMFQLLYDLKTRVITGNQAQKMATEFCAFFPDLKPIFLGILKHDLDIGIAKGTIKKVFPNMFSEFSVALSDKLNEKTESLVDWNSGEWCSSRKLDGVRCICVKKDNEVHFYARSGKEFYTLDVLKESVMKIPGEFVLDGECCIVDMNGDEDFISIVSEIKRKNWTISNPCYKVFDCLTIEEFFTNTSSVKLLDRFKRVVYKEIQEGCYPHLEAVEQRVLTSKEQFDAHFQESLEKGWEGLMLRKNVGYEGKRTKNMLKVKKFQDLEAVVIDCKNDDIKFIEDGKQETYNVLSNITIEYKGNRVDIGSGFSKAQRFWYRDRHDELIGKTVTVKYFQESKNANGTYSLRFPVVKCIYDEGRDF